MDRPKRNYQGQPQQQTYKHPSSGPRHHKGVRHPSSNFSYDVYQAGSRRLNRFSNLQLFFLAILGGAFLSAGTLFAVLISNELQNPAIEALVSGLGLALGMLLLILTNSVLVTEANIYVPGNFEHLSILRGCLRLFRFWSLAWIGNFVGASLFGLFVHLSQDYPLALQQTFISVMSSKMAYANGTLRGTGELIISGMLANWLIATATFFAVASRNIINQFVLLFLVFTLIIIANFQFFPVNLGYLLTGAFLGNSSGLVHAIFFNLIPVSLGNILGASILASGTMLFISKRR